MRKKVLTGTILLATTVLFFSCKKNAFERFNNENLLIGTWTDTVKVYPGAYYIHKLILNSNASFIEKSSLYSISGQNKFELSGWFERTGSYELNDN